LATLLQDVGVDHGGGHLVVPKQLLNGADISSALQQVGSEGMPKGVSADLLGQPGAANRRLAGTLQSSVRRGRGPRATSGRETGRTGRSTPDKSARYEWRSGGDGALYGLHRGVLVVDFSSSPAYQGSGRASGDY
jgi:hypothetical protein